MDQKVCRMNVCVLADYSGEDDLKARRYLRHYAAMLTHSWTPRLTWKSKQIYPAQAAKYIRTLCRIVREYVDATGWLRYAASVVQLRILKPVSRPGVKMDGYDETRSIIP